MPSNESGSGASTSGGIRVQHYYPVGPAVQAKGFGWSLGTWGGEEIGASTTTLNGSLSDDTAGTGGSGTSITLTDASLISYYRYKFYTSGQRRNFLHWSFWK